jgi:hypothetical protein
MATLWGKKFQRSIMMGVTDKISFGHIAALLISVCIFSKKYTKSIFCTSIVHILYFGKYFQTVKKEILSDEPTDNLSSLEHMTLSITTY